METEQDLEPTSDVLWTHIMSHSLKLLRYTICLSFASKQFLVIIFHCILIIFSVKGDHSGKAKKSLCWRKISSSEPPGCKQCHEKGGGALIRYASIVANNWTY